MRGSEHWEPDGGQGIAPHQGSTPNLVGLGAAEGPAERAFGAMPVGIAGSYTAKAVAKGRQSADGHHADNGLGPYPLWKGLCSEYPRDLQAPDNAPVLRCRHRTVQS